MGRPFFQHLEGDIYACKICNCHLASADELVSKHFHSKNGKAYLFNAVVNVCPGPKEERQMTTGMHVVSDTYCTGCFNLVGWKYEAAYDKSQKYKEGKFILECVKVTHGISQSSRDSFPVSRFEDSDSDAC